MVRTSVMAPAIAAAAAVAGLARWVRARGPWRPMKFRFEVDTERWPGATVSPLAAKHIEHPGSRHSKPASVKSLSSPSATAFRLTVSEPGSTPPPARAGGGGAQSAQPAVGARSDEDPIDGRAGDRRSALETHIVESSFDRGAPCRIGNLAWIRDATVDADDMLRANAPGHLWNDFFNVDDDFLVEHRVGVARKLARRGGPLPHLALRRVGATAGIFIRFLIRRDQAHFGAELDRKIADGKTAFDRQIVDRAAGIFDGVAGSAGSADVADQRQDEILGGHAERQSALEIDTHGFRSALDDGLRCQYMREFAGADPEGQCAQSTMRAGMAVAANDQAAGKAEAKFGPDDVDDALTGLVDIEHRNSAGRSFHPQRRQ